MATGKTSTSKLPSCAASFTYPAFTCRQWAARGAACVCWAWGAWAPPLEDEDGQDTNLHAPVKKIWAAGKQKPQWLI